MMQEGKAPEATKCLVLADPHTLFREGVVKILREAGFRVLGQTDTAHGLYQLVDQMNPDIILLDCDTLQGDPDTIRKLTEKNHGIIVLLAQPESSVSFLSAMQAGAKGCLSINLSPQEFVQALRMLAEGYIIISREVADSLRESLAREHSLKPRNHLSSRELEVLCLVGRGATNREIAEKLIVSEHTVKVHLRSILNKLNIRNRQQAAAFAVRKGLVTECRVEAHADAGP